MSVTICSCFKREVLCNISGSYLIHIEVRYAHTKRKEWRTSSAIWIDEATTSPSAEVEKDLVCFVQAFPSFRSSILRAVSLYDRPLSTASLRASTSRQPL